MTTQTINPDMLYTSEEVTDILRVSLRTTQRLLKSGMLNSFRVNGQYRVKGLDILNYLDGVRKDSEIDEKNEDKPANLVKMLEVHPISMELGLGLIKLVNPDEGGNLLEQIKDLRKEIILELGFIFPGIQFRDNLNLQNDQYVIEVNGDKVAGGNIDCDMLFVILAKGLIFKHGEKKTDPATGLPGFWITAEQKEKAGNTGAEIITAGNYLLRHLGHIAKTYAHEILSREEVFIIIEKLRKNNSVVVDEVVQDSEDQEKKLSIGKLARILRELLSEQVSIRNMRLILETIADSLEISRKPEELSEIVRQGLSRQICAGVAGEENLIEIISLAPDLEKLLEEAVKEGTPANLYAGLAPEVSRKFLENLKEIVAAKNLKVILCAPAVRRFISLMLKRNFPQVTVLSYREINQDFRLKNAAVLNI
jgi:flagellar biosynthesis protein FlhA